MNKRGKMNKRGFEFSFAWLFGIIAGIVIVFLAIYGTGRFIRTGRYQLDTITAKQLSIIFEPMETGLASGKSTQAELKEETRIYNECFDTGNFGKNTISLSTKQNIGGEWQKPGGDISIPNKYIFSDDIEEGKTYYFFSKTFEMPWKVSEIIFLTGKKYCFVNTPEEIEDEVEGLNIRNINLDNCSASDIKVCFGSGSESNCEILVSGTCMFDCKQYEYGFVTKNKESVFYTNSLIYGAIFSSKEVYECNVKRLMKRLRQQALLYKDEASFISSKCGSLPVSGFLQIINLAKNFDKSEDLLAIRKTAKEVDEQNDVAECNLW